ncbi:bifunctional DNA primase/polymerase [uncultured Mediterranean phage uvDeep-CGR2-KM19-C184]|nr:bifunctional DNA primase/polymerase [uncultured Mediterranean phage uvDeep-CGR2-KM19-C184]
MNLQEFVAQLPSGLVYAPIYRKGAQMASGKPATGKNPLEASFDRKFDAADVALAIQRNPELHAVGVFTGIRGNGIVILDVDLGLKKLLKVWGSSLEGAPIITSTKSNAAKYLFRVPEDLWSSVEGRGLGDQDYEILWNSKRQGVIYGEYPGSKNSEPGQYKISGDLSSIPIAPDWLLAEMKQPAKAINKRDPDFTDRTQDEIFEIVRDCLNVIPCKGAGSRDHWVRIGMAINSALPNEMGFMLWSAWSAEDSDYASEWENDNPCADVWNTFKGNGVGIGTLIHLADREDPKRLRFSDSLAKVVKSAEEKIVQEFRTATLEFEEVIRRSKQILNLDNPAEVNYKLNSLALQAGYRDQSALEKLIVDQIAFEKKVELLTVEELMEKEAKRDYLIPDVLPHPSVVLVYGAGGDGKSTAAWALAGHIASGKPFKVRGAEVPVEQGPVLLLNGDQGLPQLKEQLIEADFPVNSDTYIRSDWQLRRYAQFIKLMEKYKPKLVVIDSLIGCSGGAAFDENKSEFATPLYWLTKNNGQLFPATTILIIHHANKNGGFRGTSAIRDAVDETWSLQNPHNPENKLQNRPMKDQRVEKHERLITIEKSRSGRSGTKLKLGQNEDLGFYIEDFTPEMDPEDNTPSSVAGRVLSRLRTAFPESRTKTDLLADPLVAGSAVAIKKTLQRMEDRKLIVSYVLEGSRSKHYQAVLACGEGQKLSPSTSKPSAGAVSEGGQSMGDNPLCPPLMDGAVEIELTEEQRGQL